MLFKKYIVYSIFCRKARQASKFALPPSHETADCGG